MRTAATIILAREDLSIPGAAPQSGPASDQATAVQAHFFNLIERSRPDVIVLDFSHSCAPATDTILTIRRRTDIPILVVCDSASPLVEDYRIAGAADCIAAPVTVATLHEAIQRIMRVRGCGAQPSRKAPDNFYFAAMRFYPQRNLLVGRDASTIELTSLEGRLLTHFVSKPWMLCTRSELAELLYGHENGVGHRAIDVAVNRLRRKLLSAGADDAEQLIKTEFRRGYCLLADVETQPRDPSARVAAAVHATGW